MVGGRAWRENHMPRVVEKFNVHVFVLVLILPAPPSITELTTWMLLLPSPPLETVWENAYPCIHTACLPCLLQPSKRAAKDERRNLGISQVQSIICKCLNYLPRGRGRTETGRQLVRSSLCPQRLHLSSPVPNVLLHRFVSVQNTSRPPCFLPKKSLKWIKLSFLHSPSGHGNKYPSLITVGSTFFYFSCSWILSFPSSVHPSGTNDDIQYQSGIIFKFPIKIAINWLSRSFKVPPPSLRSA